METVMFYYRVKSTGQWCAAVLSVSQKAWQERYAAAIGIDLADLEEVEAEQDPRSGDFLKEPPRPVVANRDDQLALVFEQIAKDPALAPATKTAIGQAVAVLRSGR
jgi:hypothetical protein